MGLRLGIHTLRGSISSEAIAKKSPILGGNGVTVDQIATTKCPWNHNWFAANQSNPAAAAFIDSVARPSRSRHARAISDESIAMRLSVMEYE